MDSATITSTLADSELKTTKSPLQPTPPPMSSSTSLTPNNIANNRNVNKNKNNNNKLNIKTIENTEAVILSNNFQFETSINYPKNVKSVKKTNKSSTLFANSCYNNTCCTLVNNNNDKKNTLLNAFNNPSPNPFALQHKQQENKEETFEKQLIETLI